MTASTLDGDAIVFVLQLVGAGDSPGLKLVGIELDLRGIRERVIEPYTVYRQCVIISCK